MPTSVGWKLIVRDVVNGMTDSQLCDKYALSADQLKAVYQRLAEIRRRRIRALVCDLAQGVDPMQLMEKYGLSPRAMVKVLNHILRGSLNCWIREARSNRVGFQPADPPASAEPRFLNARPYPPRPDMTAAIGYPAAYLDDLRQ